MKFSEFFQQIFSTKFYLLTIASFRIGVPSILFKPKICGLNTRAGYSGARTVYILGGQCLFPRK